MNVARRVYIYLISFISLMVMLVGASALAGLVVTNFFNIPLSPWIERREVFSVNAALFVVGGLVWGVHWWLAQRSVAAGKPGATEERRSLMRKLMVYATLFVSLMAVFLSLLNLVQYSLAYFSHSSYARFGEEASNAGASFIVYAVAWAYYWRVRQQDGALAPEEGAPTTVRRWYVYLAAYLSLSGLMYGVSEAGRHLLAALTSSKTLSFSMPYDSYFTAVSPLSVGIGFAVAGLAVWAFLWFPAQAFTARSEDEQHSVLRKVYVYGAVLQTAIVALIGLAMFLYNLLKEYVGTGAQTESGESTLAAIGKPVVTLIVYGAFWAYHWRVINWDAGFLAEERPLQANVRRLYYHLVSLIGLGVLAVGVVNMLQVGFKWLLGGFGSGNLALREWGDQVSLFITLIVVGAPVWLITWLQLERRAHAPSGEEERQSLLRRIYLFVVLFAGMVAVLGCAAWLVYRTLLVVSGAMQVDDARQMAQAIGGLITSAALVAYHLGVLLSDQRAAAAARAAIPVTSEAVPTTTLVLLQGGSSATVNAAIDAMKRKLPAGAHVDVLSSPDLTPATVTAWLVSRNVEPEAETLEPASTPVPAPGPDTT